MLANPALHAIAPATNPYGDGQAADRIVGAFEYLIGVSPPPTRFGPGFSRRELFLAAGYPADAVITTLAEERGLQPDRTEEHDAWVGR